MFFKAWERVYISGTVLVETQIIRKWNPNANTDQIRWQRSYFRPVINNLDASHGQIFFEDTAGLGLPMPVSTRTLCILPRNQAKLSEGRTETPNPNPGSKFEVWGINPSKVASLSPVEMARPVIKRGMRHDIIHDQFWARVWLDWARQGKPRQIIQTLKP